MEFNRDMTYVRGNYGKLVNYMYVCMYAHKSNFKNIELYIETTSPSSILFHDITVSVFLEILCVFMLKVCLECK